MSSLYIDRFQWIENSEKEIMEKFLNNQIFISIHKGIPTVLYYSGMRQHRKIRFQIKLIVQNNYMYEFQTAS